MIKIGISSNINFYNTSLPILIPSLIESGIDPDNIHAFIGGYTTYSTVTNEDGTHYHFVDHNSLDNTALIEICDKKIPSEYWITNVLHCFKIILLEKYGTFPIYYIIDGCYLSPTFINSDVTLDKLNPLYIIFGKGKEYIGDMNDYLLLERL